MTSDDTRWRLGHADSHLGQLHWRRKGSGTPFVLLPAASQSHNHLIDLGDCLARNYEVVIIDMPGSGYGVPLPESVEFADLAVAVAEVIATLFAGPVLLYGIHTGNKIAASLAAQRPALLHGLVLCGQSHSLIVDKATRTAQMRQVSAKRFPPQSDDAAAGRQRERAELWREIETMWFAPAMMSGTEEPRQAARMRASVADLLLSLDSLPALYQANFRYDLAADLARITVPTLIAEIATPREDAAIGRQAGAAAALIAGGRTATFIEPDGLGLTLEDRADELCAAILAFTRTIPGLSIPTSKDPQR